MRDTTKIPDREPDRKTVLGADLYCEFRMCTERDFFDCKRCPSSEGWQTYHTPEDAPYYGVWVNLGARQIVSFTEGDEDLVVCSSEELFQAELARLRDFHHPTPEKPISVWEECTRDAHDWAFDCVPPMTIGENCFTLGEMAGIDEVFVYIATNLLDGIDKPQRYFKARVSVDVGRAPWKIQAHFQKEYLALRRYQRQLKNRQQFMPEEPRG